MASSSRQQMEDLSGEDETKFLSEKIKRASVMLGFGAARWSGTIVGQKFDKTLVLTVAHTLSTAPWLRTKEEIEPELSAYFYENPKKKCACRTAFCRENYDMLLLVVDKISAADDKLIFAMDEESNLKELQLLGCRGHPVGLPWRIATGRVCYPLIVNNGDHPMMPDFDPNMVFFEHRLGLGRGYSGAALLNEKGSIVGMNTAVSTYKYHVMGTKALHVALEERKKFLAAISEAKMEPESLKDESENLLINLGDLRYRQGDDVTIKIPKSHFKFAIHVKYLHGKLLKALQAEGASTEQSLDKALEDHYIKY